MNAYPLTLITRDGETVVAYDSDGAGFATVSPTASYVYARTEEGWKKCEVSDLERIDVQCGTRCDKCVAQRERRETDLRAALVETNARLDALPGLIASAATSMETAATQTGAATATRDVAQANVTAQEATVAQLWETAQSLEGVAGQEMALQIAQQNHANAVATLTALKQQLAAAQAQFVAADKSLTAATSLLEKTQAELAEKTPFPAAYEEELGAFRDEAISEEVAAEWEAAIYA
jgi:chromosome segregation ATPase